MIDLQPGEIFELEGASYEVDSVDDRIIIAYVLDGGFDRIPCDRFPEGWLLTAFSDLRYWKEHPPWKDLI